MKKMELDINDLSKATNTKPRNIHFYRKENLLKGDLKGAGRGARYTEEHLVRLLVIKKLQREHIKLSGIKKTMQEMSFAEMEEFVQDELDRLNRSTEIPSVDDLDNSFSLSKPDFSLPPRDNREEIPGQAQANDISFLELREDNDTRSRHSKTRGQGHILSRVTRTTSFHRETWQRINVTEGVELNIRQDVLRAQRRLIDQVLREIRETLER